MMIKIRKNCNIPKESINRNRVNKANSISNKYKIKNINIKEKLFDKIQKNEITDIINNKKEEKNEKAKPKEEGTIDESIIVNDSDVFGTLSLNLSQNKKIKQESAKKKEEIEVLENEKDDGNKHTKNKTDVNNNNQQDCNIIKSYNNSTLRQTITISYEENNKNNNSKCKLMKAEEILKIDEHIKNFEANTNDLNKLSKAKNNTNTNFKSYYFESIPGKNYGSTKTNQDIPITCININGIEGFNIFGVLDGHGVNGHLVSKFLSEYLVKEIKETKSISQLKNLEEIYKVLSTENFVLLINIFFKADKILGEQNFDVNFSGTTCVLVIQLGQKIICANVGDSRAILIYDENYDSELKTSKIFELSHDWKPDLPEEKKRIIKMGGVVDQMLDYNGVRGGPQRVWAKYKNYPGLAMSRSLGDYQGKQCGIIPLPEIIEYNLDNKSKYMVICSDGVWEFLSNNDVMNIGNEYYIKNDAQGFIKYLINKSENLWEKQDVIVDDITAVVVFF